MDGPRGYHTKWGKSKTNIILYQLYVESKKIMHTYLFTKQTNRNRLTDTENKFMVTQEGRGGKW